MGPGPFLHRWPASLSLPHLGPRSPYAYSLAPPVEIWPGATLSYLNLWAPHRGLSRYTRCSWAGELLPAAPLQPCAGAPSGRGHLFSGWVNLAPCNFSSNNVLLAVQAWGTPSAWRHVPRPPPSGGFHPVGGLYPSLASIFPAHYCPLHHLVSARHNIKCDYSIK